MEKAGPLEAPLLDIAARWARVTGVNGRFVLFDFTIADRDLTIELIMPYQAFHEFCADNHAVMSVQPGAKADFERLKWLAGDVRRIRSSAPATPAR